ncbi:MAG: hypothetical protein IJL72_02790 [Lachnospiraceae bacterium]|nr:hypothetical protein [Lachnospiraceae bacterium]
MNNTISLRCATHNLCHFGKSPFDRDELFPDHSYRNGYEPEMLPVMKERWKAVYDSFDADLIGLQEYCPFFDLAHTIPVPEQVFLPYGLSVYADDFVNAAGHRLAAASKTPLLKAYERSFMPVSERRYQKFFMDIHGRRIAVFNTHPMPKGTPEAIATRQAEYRILLKEFRKEKTFIAFGDFNARTAEEFGIFLDAGLKMANTGTGTEEHGLTCDNIIVSPDFTIQKTALSDSAFSLSDHAVLRAELLLA